MNQLVVDLLIVAMVLWAATVGYRRGFVIEAVDLAGFILAILAASVFHRQAGQLLVGHLDLPPSFAPVVAYAAIAVTVEILYLLSARWLLSRWHGTISHSTWNSFGGGALNSFKALVLIAVFLTVFAGLPLSPGQKDTVTTARIPRVLLSYSGGLQRSVNELIGSTIADTLNFFTVKPQSHETVDLGFTTTDVREDPAAEDVMLRLVNRERTSRGLNALSPNPTARRVARTHSRDMFARGYFSHVNPDGADPFDRMSAGGVKYRAAGENLALAPTIEMAHRGLMNSPGHRANILSTDFNTVGMGVINGGRYGLMVTQNFTD
jgi:uncharacterized protein YkwD